MGPCPVSLGSKLHPEGRRFDCMLAEHRLLARVITPSPAGCLGVIWWKGEVGCLRVLHEPKRAPPPTRSVRMSTLKSAGS